MRISLKKAITFILAVTFCFSLLGFSSSTLAANGKISPEIGAKDDEKPNLVVPVEEVTRISNDEEVHICLDTATDAINAPNSWEQGFTGKGVTVAVIDTGIYPHPDLAQLSNRIVAFKDFINKRALPYDDNGHGTHVAGIIAGSGAMSNGQYQGVAPQANLVGVKVLDSSGNGRTSDVIAGIQWVVDNKNTYGIKVINMSLGTPASESYTTDPYPLSQAAEAAWNAGLVVVAAAGNRGPLDGTITTPGINPHVITVGAVMSGTSMATTMVAGATALLLEQNPNWTPSEVKMCLIDNSRDLGFTVYGQGAGIISY